MIIDISKVGPILIRL